MYAEPSSLFACCARLERSFYPRGADPQARPHDRLCPHLHRPLSLCPKLVVDLLRRPPDDGRKRCNPTESTHGYQRFTPPRACRNERAPHPTQQWSETKGVEDPPIVSLPITKSTAVRGSSARYNLSTDAPPEPPDGAQRAEHQRRTARSSLPPVHSWWAVR